MTTTVVYDKWDVGEFGTMNPAKAPNGSWTGKNVVVYRDGMIGPRPGLRRIMVGNPGINGPLLGLGFSPTAQTGDTPIFYILDDRVYLFDPNESATPTLYRTGTDLAAAPADTDASRVLSKESVRLIGDEVYFTVNDDAAYRLNCRTQTLTRITDSDPEGQGTDIEMYRDRVLVANGGNRIFYTDAADFDTWEPGSFFDVGAAYRIIAMLTFRDVLVIFTQSGVWALSGTPDDGTLRRISETLAPLDKGAVVSADSIYYIPASRPAPVMFNGSVGDENGLAHLNRWKPASANAYGVQSYGNRDIIFLSSGGQMLWRKNNAWSIHDIEVSAGPWITRYFDDHVVIAYPGTASAKPKFYMMPMTLDRPAFTDDDWARPGDDSDTPIDAEFTLPDFPVKDGKEVRVRKITLDYVKYDTGSPATNRIELTITGRARQNAPGDASVSWTVLDEAGSEASTNGTYARSVYHGTPIGFAGTVRIRLHSLRGVKIDRMIVEYDEQDTPV